MKYQVHLAHQARTRLTPQIALLAVPCYHCRSMDQNWQQQVADFARKHDLLHDRMTHALDLVAEVGEVAKGILRTTRYGRSPLSPSPEIEEELGDSLYSLLTLAEACGVDAGEALQTVLAKYEQRLKQHGDAGSRHEL